jgi:flagellar basal-body rod modification protein FlgD
MNSAAAPSTQALSGLLGAGSADAAATQPGTQTSAKQALGMGNFLTLFTTQLKYQDPTSPLQSHELAAQLAQFSTVEQLANLNASMKEVQAYLASLNNAQMIDLIGKEVVGASTTLRLVDGKVSSASYQTEAPATVTVRIFDEEGIPVRTLSVGQQPAGSYQVKWDGRSDAGAQLGNGNYTYTVDAVGVDGNPVKVKSTIRGTVYSFRLEDGVPRLILGGPDGVQLSAGEIQEVVRPSV